MFFENLIKIAERLTTLVGRALKRSNFYFIIKKIFDFSKIIVIIYIENLKKAKRQKPNGEEKKMTIINAVNKERKGKERKGKERAYYI